MKMNATTAASIEAYETKLTTVRDSVTAAITAHEATKREREEAEKRNAADIAKKKKAAERQKNRE